MPSKNNKYEIVEKKKMSFFKDLKTVTGAEGLSFRRRENMRGTYSLPVRVKILL